jgi:23S rRNA (cytidine2498-2'-O)-methyltransferase
MSSRASLVLCQPGFEGTLAREIACTPEETGPGWILCGLPGEAVRQAAFAHSVLDNPVLISGEKVNEIASGVFETFAEGIQGERLEASWPCIFAAPPEPTGLGRRLASVEGAFQELLRKKFGRLARLATEARPRIGPARGLFVWFTDFGRLRVAHSAYFCGQQRMADDDLAPSRSYLKIEEAYGIAGAEPGPGQTVCDLGAAPGGWTYSAAKRGARVVAVDNGPLKGGALDNPLVEYRKVDAFGFKPLPGEPYDWLFCDMLEDPRTILLSIVEPWLSGGWCRRFVVNLKMGRVDPVAFLRDLRSPGSPFMKHSPSFRIAHLYHDRDEITVIGEGTA